MNIPSELAIDIAENSHVLAIAEFAYDGTLISYNRGFRILFAIFLSETNNWHEFFVGAPRVTQIIDLDSDPQLLKTTKGEGLLCSFRKMESSFYCIAEMLELKDEKLIEEISSLSNLMAQLNFQLRREKRQLIKAQKDIERIAREDPLTSLLNRRAFFDIINPKLSLAKRQNMEVTLFFIDLDFFKSVNDNWGHNIGDILLVAIANMLKKTLRLEDIISRFGGEEFVVVLTGQSLTDSFILANRILENCRALKIASMDRVNTLSIGIAQWDKNEDINKLIKRADDACYMAKNSGRNKYIALSPETATSH
ncbi:GGDEF domain-containing protein [Shewanella sp. 6_MG-2023]|uniref:GGDEF domain-containing protein n=1 Tax=Shewanella sp. 6_MG-2023 TaxID=3062660 RepID=UPI0026E364BB|nr:GGDEF domain-containing protein [Shewanella sp. 6_MG-2023]MDO6620777.1 GGDEF domain-containing protein [Shewanella sp. 6_MG-2023]